jgi:hypothetical protein
MSFKVGDEVTWRSQANGNYSLKKGKIVIVVPAWVSPFSVLFNTSYSDYRLKFAQRGWRSDESYLVAVRTRLYWPHVRQLCKVNEQRVETSGYVAAEDGAKKTSAQLRAEAIAALSTCVQAFVVVEGPGGSGRFVGFDMNLNMVPNVLKALLEFISPEAAR